MFERPSDDRDKKGKKKK
jgi:hypothetical protein